MRLVVCSMAAKTHRRAAVSVRPSPVGGRQHGRRAELMAKTRGDAHAAEAAITQAVHTLRTALRTV